MQNICRTWEITQFIDVNSICSATHQPAAVQLLRITKWNSPQVTQICHWSFYKMPVIIYWINVIEVQPLLLEIISSKTPVDRKSSRKGQDTVWGEKITSEYHFLNRKGQARRIEVATINGIYGSQWPIKQLAITAFPHGKHTFKWIWFTTELPYLSL